MRRQRRRLGLLRRGCRHQHMHVQRRVLWQRTGMRAVPDMRRQRRRLGLLRRGCRHQHMHVQCGIFGHWRCLRVCLQPSISTLFIDLVFLCLLVPGGGVR